ncbi:MAG TPA: hypothetical protein VJB66_01995 [Candidatus Nanoarchaeia archaeon]|nr:hypothetical protein [Candidatus Nanoarchaeia archaeon]
MKCVVDTSPIVWLNKIGQFELLKDVYSTLYTTPGVKKQLDKTTVPVAFIDELVVPSDIKNYEQRFAKLVRRWTRKLHHADVVDIEVLIAYKFFTEDADEMLFANKDAKAKFTQIVDAPVRDLTDLYEPAERLTLFSRSDSITYLEKLRDVGFRRTYIEHLLLKLTK